MCSMALSRLASPPDSAKRSVMTFCPLNAAKVSGATNSRALRVITTCTLKPSCCKRRTSSAALYAATPPVTPSVIRIAAFRGPLFPPLASVLILSDCCRLLEFILEQAVLQLFTGDSRGLLRSRILDQRRRSGHELPRAPGREHHVSKLALRSFCLHSHFSLSLQMMPEVVPPGPAGDRWCSARRLQSPALPGRRVPRGHSPRKNRNTCRTPQFHRALWPGGARSLHRNPGRGRAACAPAPHARAAK